MLLTPNATAFPHVIAFPNESFASIEGKHTLRGSCASWANKVQPPSKGSYVT
ncbi:predicted protein [Plenodomus lingam JN3]|uniref:Uncharacterized protein n=1 Tax=Leptosphaeria maculans (strain JN3 / isolate v23.1.3 / race Av1-4-5-6-7-8) TaxID=985895 RepID=E5A795_LEPMJ|nr:predicted protein [Plenodomus lingam JN3]CBX99490.1 predicted protein [Plenodomus lingam JN3]